MDHQEGLLVRHDIPADLFTEFLGIPEGIKVVILDLKGDAQFLAELIKMSAICLTRSTEHGTHLQTRGQQHRGLEADHVDIFVQTDGVIGLEIHVQLLAFADLHGRPVETVHDPPDVRAVDPVQIIIGYHEHDIPSQQSGWFSILCMHRRFSSAQGRLVHDVVMDQREIVK